MPSRPDHDDHQRITERDSPLQVTLHYLTQQISFLVCAISEHREQIRKEAEWFKSHNGLATKCDLKEMECRIMATQAEVVEELRTLKGQVGKIRTEVTDAKNELQATIKRLEDLLAAGGTGQATAELVAIKDELKAEFQTLDDLHTDAPLPPTPA